MTPNERFWMKVDKEGPVPERRPDLGPCWEWRGAFNLQTYGNFWLRGRQLKPHRFSYEQAMGEIPVGLTIDHLCRNQRCVNPLHLEAVTNKENILRGDGITAMEARKNKCLRGHPYTKENTYRRPGSDDRQCRTCMRQRDSRRK